MEDEQIVAPAVNANKTELWNLSIRDIFYKYVRFLPLFLLSLALALLIAWIYLRYATRIYSSSGTLLIQNELASRGRGDDKAEDILIGGNRTGSIQSEIEILKSRPLMERVVKKINLQFNYTAIGKIKEFNIYKQGPFQIEAFEVEDSASFFATKIKFINAQQFRVNNEVGTFTFNQIFKNKNGVFRLIKTGQPVGGTEFTVSWTPASSIASSYASAIKVEPKIPGTTILRISMLSTNGQLAADIINHLMIQYDSMTIEQNNYSTDQMLGFIDARLNILSDELDTLQMKYLRYKQSTNLFDIETQSGQYFERISEADKQINEYTWNVAVTEELTKYLSNRDKQFDRLMVPSSMGLQDNTLNELVTGYNKAQLERQSLTDDRTPPDNPAMVIVQGEIEKLRTSLLENLRNLQNSYNNAIAVLRKRSQSEEQALQSVPYKQKDMVEMERQITTKTTLYNLLQQKREEAAIGRASTISNSKIIDRAGASTTPVKPNKKTIQIFAVLLGLGIPALVIFIGEVVNDKVSTRFDIEKITAAPILGEVGHSYSDSTLVVNKTSRGMVAEQFRIIRSNLQYVLTKSDKSVILVTSSFSGEGKSFVSTNMGAVLALSGKKTLIMEFDIRKPKVLHGLGISRRTGISNYLVGKAELSELIIPVPEYPNLFVFPCGPIPPNPSELLLDPKVTQMFNQLKSEYDVIFVDTAPVGMVSDAMTLGKFADCTLYLVRQGHTFKKQVALIDEFYRDKKLPRVSIIINDVKLKPGYGYYGYGRYGYGYGYGQKSSYYEEETPPTDWFERMLGKLKIKKRRKKRN